MRPENPENLLITTAPGFRDIRGFRDGGDRRLQMNDCHHGVMKRLSQDDEDGGVRDPENDDDQSVLIMLLIDSSVADLEMNTDAMAIPKSPNIPKMVERSCPAIFQTISHLGRGTRHVDGQPTVVWIVVADDSGNGCIGNQIVESEPIGCLDRDLGQDRIAGRHSQPLPGRGAGFNVVLVNVVLHGAPPVACR